MLLVYLLAPLHLQIVLIMYKSVWHFVFFISVSSFNQEQGVGVINASTLGMGLLSSRDPADWHPATPEIKRACADGAKYIQVI